MPRTVKTLAQLIVRVRNILEEPIAARWSDDMITDYLNKAQEDLAILAERLKTSEVTLTAGEGTLSFPDDFLMLSELFWDDGTFKHEIKSGSSKIPLDDDTDTDTVDGPQYFYLIDGAIEVRPLQSTDTDIIITYYEDPPEMEDDTDTPAFNHSQDTLIAGAVYKAYLDDNDPRQQPWLENYSREQMRWLAIETQNYQDAFQQQNNW